MTETVGARIQRLARERGLPSGKQLAQALGVRFESLRLWTVGETAPSRKRAQVAADYLGVPVEVVMHGALPPARQPDAEAIADAFDALPSDTPQAMALRRLVYVSVAGLIAAHAPQPASAAAQEPAERPSAAHRPQTQRQP